MASYIDALRGVHTSCLRLGTGSGDRGRRHSDLTAVAIQGYEAPPATHCPHDLASPVGLAWRVGQWLQTTGRTRPRDVRMSRGHSLHVNDMVVVFKNGAFERQS
jgi:hypothetical protein